MPNQLFVGGGAVLVEGGQVGGVGVGGVDGLLVAANGVGVFALLEASVAFVFEVARRLGHRRRGPGPIQTIFWLILCFQYWVWLPSFSYAMPL